MTGFSIKSEFDLSERPDSKAREPDGPKDEVPQERGVSSLHYAILHFRLIIHIKLGCQHFPCVTVSMSLWGPQNNSFSFSRDPSFVKKRKFHILLLLFSLSFLCHHFLNVKLNYRVSGYSQKLTTSGL